MYTNKESTKLKNDIKNETFKRHKNQVSDIYKELNKKSFKLSLERLNTFYTVHDSKKIIKNT